MNLLPIIVAIPARNEAGRIAACLQALALQPAARQHIAAVCVFANNCTDATVAVVGAMQLPFSVRIVDAQLPPAKAHIGYARCGAADLALTTIQAQGLDDAIIFSTDADSQVANDWLSALVAAMAPAVDAVCGAIDLDGPVAPTLAAARAVEARYAEAVARAAALLDPQAHDPWPNHIWCWGANIAVRARCLMAVGGMPTVKLAEDRALHAELLRHDARIRHSVAPRVITSARLKGRAPGGLADLMTSYSADPEALADYWLEPAATAWHRAAIRGAARRAWGDQPGFGAYWFAVEASDPTLTPTRVTIADLPAEIQKLEGWIRIATSRADTLLRAAETPIERPAATHG